MVDKTIQRIAADAAMLYGIFKKLVSKIHLFCIVGEGNVTGVQYNTRKGIQK
jgi:hypothetical protein